MWMNRISKPSIWMFPACLSHRATTRYTSIHDACRYLGYVFRSLFWAHLDRPYRALKHTFKSYELNKPYLRTISYGGPGSQMVDKSFNRDWHEYLACRHQYIIVTVDGRGTGHKGRKLRNTVKGNLGFFETIDQINAAK